MFFVFQSDHENYAELVEETSENRISESTTDRSRFACLKSLKPMSIRYRMAFLSSLGFLISFGIRCNMGVSVVAMTHNETEILSNGTMKLIKVKQIDRLKIFSKILFV